MLHSAWFRPCHSDWLAASSWLQVSSYRLASCPTRLASSLPVSLGCLWVCSARLVSSSWSLALDCGPVSLYWFDVCSYAVFVQLPLACVPAVSLLIHSNRCPSADCHHSCFGCCWVSLPELMSRRSVSTACPTGSSRLSPGRLIWDVVLQVPLCWWRLGHSL